jgi:hypothetical protein
MHIKELYRHVNELREKNNLPPVSEEKFTADISAMQIKGLVAIEHEQVRPVKSGKEYK